MIRTLKYFRRVAPKTGWKYVRKVFNRTVSLSLTMTVFLWLVAWLLSTDDSVFSSWLYNYKILIYLFLVVLFLSWNYTLQELDKQMNSERRDMLQSLFVKGVVNSTFVYRDAETIDQVFSRAREVVTKNTRVDFYNDVYLWDFDELLTECLKDLRSDVDSNIRAESDWEPEEL